MEEIKEGYKLVRIKINKDKLYFTSAFDDGRVLEYKPFEWTKPQKGDGPLAIFETEKNTLDFLNKCKISHYNKILHYYKIFKCKYIKTLKTRFLWTMKYGLEIFNFGNLPEGTVLADAVMITEEINYKDKKYND